MKLISLEEMGHGKWSGRKHNVLLALYGNKKFSSMWPNILVLPYESSTSTTNQMLY